MRQLQLHSRETEFSAFLH